MLAPYIIAQFNLQLSGVGSLFHPFLLGFLGRESVASSSGITVTGITLLPCVMAISGFPSFRIFFLSVLVGLEPPGFPALARKRSSRFASGSFSSLSLSSNIAGSTGLGAGSGLYGRYGSIVVSKGIFVSILRSSFILRAASSRDILPSSRSCMPMYSSSSVSLGRYSGSGFREALFSGSSKLDRRAA